MARNGLLRQANFGLPCLLDHSSLLVRTGLTDAEDDLLTFFSYLPRWLVPGMILAGTERPRVSTSTRADPVSLDKVLFCMTAVARSADGAALSIAPLRVESTKAPRSGPPKRG